MGVYGLLGIFIFALMLFFVFMTIMRIPPGPEKFYCLALFTFLVVASQANVLNFKKIYWLIIGIIMACEWVTPLFEQEEPPYYLEQENNFL
jgi:TctA family transporter